MIKQEIQMTKVMSYDSHPGLKDVLKTTIGIAKSDFVVASMLILTT